MFVLKKAVHCYHKLGLLLTLRKKHLGQHKVFRVSVDLFLAIRSANKDFSPNFNCKTQTLWREAQTYKKVVEEIQRVFYAPILFSFEFVDCNSIPLRDLLPPEKQKRKKGKLAFLHMYAMFFKNHGS